MTIATVDFSAFSVAEGVLASEAATKAQLTAALQIDNAMRTHGFVQLVHIGVPNELRRAAFEHMHALFSLPDEYKKSQLARITPPGRNGYKPYRTEAVNKARSADLNECFNVLPPKMNSKNDFAGCPDGFGDGMIDFWHEVNGLARRFAVALALAAQLPSDYFARTLNTQDMWTLRMNHYPPCMDEGKTRQSSKTQALRIGEHTDFGGFTLLFLGAGATGLQVKPVEGGEVGTDTHEWLEVHAAPEEDCVIVNTGSLLARWTNDVWRAAAHRVVVPDEETARVHRYSMACFIDPDGDTSIEAHPRFVEEQGEAKYAPVNARDHKLRLVAELMKPPVVARGCSAEEGGVGEAGDDEPSETGN